MNNEIKEILDYISDRIIPNEKWNKVRDYITNLQQRIEKAINKAQDIIDIGFDYDGYNDVNNLKILVDELVDLARQTKDILNGRSDE